jgi:glucokinase-like ROK family protein
MTPSDVTRSFRGKLLVSCQAGEGDIFHDPQLMARFAAAAVAGGAAGIRANGPDDIRAIRSAVKVPIIGIEKLLHYDGLPLITPSFAAATALVEAGADMIALDCSERGQQAGALARIREIQTQLRVPVLADVANIVQAIRAVDAGADFVLSTLRGYTAETKEVVDFDPTFIAELVRACRVPVMAEGRIVSPEQARQAIAAGALAVVVGTAITRPAEIARNFAAAIESEHLRRNALQYTVGIDLGGTQTKYGVVGSDGELLFKAALQTPAKSGAAVLLDHLKNVSRKATTKAAELGCEPLALGIATAGWVEADTGRVAFATGNLPGWTGTPVGEELAQASGLLVAVENDGNALAIGEKHFGAAKSLADFACITLGTGLGAGCYTGGKLNRGAHYFANALGHIPLVVGGELCSCGVRGCLEPYANAAALVRYANDSQITPERVIAAANAGEQRAIDAICTLARHLARGCAALVSLLDPEALILGGGLVEDNPLLISALAEELALLVRPWENRALRIMPSQLGYYGGVLGAAALAFERARIGNLQDDMVLNCRFH